MGSFNFFPSFIKYIIKITLKNFFCPENDGVTRNFKINSLFACLFVCFCLSELYYIKEMKVRLFQ